MLDAYPGERVMVGEVALPWTEIVARYYGSGDELHLAFNFPPIFAPWEAGAWRAADRATRRRELDPRGAWPTWVLSNHDNRRHRTRYGSEARARAAAVLLLGAARDAVPLRGRGARARGRRRARRTACSTPAAATAAARRFRGSARRPRLEHGATPWLPVAARGGAARSVAAQREDAGSILHLYRRLLRARRGSPALREGSFARLDVARGRARLGARRRATIAGSSW